MSRNPKPTSKHKRDGTYRADRHGGRVDAVVASGRPLMPRDLPPVAVKAWRMVLRDLPPEALAGVDALGLEVACRAFAMARTAAKEGDWKTFKEASNEFRQWAGRFGLTPVDRAKIHAPVPEEGDELDEVTKLRAV